MAKRIMGSVKLQVKGGQANPSPPIGPALGQYGVNIADFCKKKGLLFHYAARGDNCNLLFTPPLIITKEQVEYEIQYYEQIEGAAMVAWFK